ncbi:TetR/AcrR family transcriptional regulator [Ideonella sp. DXS29W]|uniref:TetR/AcrR family transcriptional regulator n=1 Tax=Ideonella lacteola TaxID=2984193 RepID=A0ABU9BZV7_9BURK
MTTRSAGTPPRPRRRSASVAGRDAPAAAPATVSVKAGYHHGDLARALVQAAMHLVEQGGPAALTLRDAARLAGVSVAAPYRHFADREALLAAVLTAGFDGLTAHTEAARQAAPDALQALRAVGLAYVDFAAAHPSVYRLMFGPECDKAAHPDLMDAGARARGVLLLAVRNAQAAGLVGGGPPETVALAGWSICHGLASLHVDGMLAGTIPMPIEQAARAVVDMLLAGAVLAPAGAARR